MYWQLIQKAVHNADALHRLVSSRPHGTPLLTVSNHMSTYGSGSPYDSHVLLFLLLFEASG